MEWVSKYPACISDNEYFALKQENKHDSNPIIYTNLENKTTPLKVSHASMNIYKCTFTKFVYEFYFLLNKFTTCVPLETNLIRTKF